MKARAAVALVLAALAAPLAAAEEDRPAQPFELVRSLRFLQDRIAQGDTAAHANQASSSATSRVSFSPSVTKSGRTRETVAPSFSTH